MHLVDRANNCLPLLLSEPALKIGEIAFVAHSFGGLIVAELLRVADARSTAEDHVANFLQRVRRIAFLGTPHLGADLASLGGRLALVSRASSVLRSFLSHQPQTLLPRAARRKVCIPGLGRVPINLAA
jgi:pimeloyl-ACP methyl ester carboxylesterase